MDEEEGARVEARLAQLEQPRAVAAAFGLAVDATTATVPFGDGLIHATWLVDAIDRPLAHAELAHAL